MIVDGLLDAMHLRNPPPRAIVGVIAVVLLVTVAMVFLPSLFGVDVSPAVTSAVAVCAAAAYLAANTRSRRA